MLKCDIRECDSIATYTTYCGGFYCELHYNHPFKCPHNCPIMELKAISLIYDTFFMKKHKKVYYCSGICKK